MFRRNRPHRPFRRLRGSLFNPNGSLAADARQAFDEANALYDGGDFAGAAGQFAHLAEQARNFNRPRRVVQLHLRAFEAWVKAKDGDQALAEARAALTVASVYPRRAGRMAQAVIAELQANGFSAQASALAKEVNGLLGPSQAGGAAVAPAPARLKFPAACPQCGGRLPRSFGEDELECDYCGSVVRAE
jgi:hypothetical protein